MYNAFDTYVLYNGLKTHFTSKSYDYIKYNGKTNVKKETFLKNKARYLFQRLSRKYNEDEMKDMLIANFSYNPTVWVNDLFSEEAESRYADWKKYNQALTYHFKEDVEKLFEKYTPKELFSINDNGIPVIITEFQQGTISLESLCLLCHFFSAFKIWEDKELDDLIYPNFEMRIKKYYPFIRYDKQKLVVILKEILAKSAK